MTHPEEQESQIADPLFYQDLVMPSSPLSGSPHDAPVQDNYGEDHLGSDGALSGFDTKPGTQHDSLGSRIGETQFDVLFPETQNANESQHSFHNPEQPPRPPTTNESAASVKPTSPEIALTIERPKVYDLVGDAVFKFGKVQTRPPFDFGRLRGKATNNDQPATSTGASKNPLSLTRSKSPPAAGSPARVANQSLFPPEKMRIRLDMNHGHNMGFSTHDEALQPTSAETANGILQVVSRPRVPGLEEATALPPKPACRLESSAEQTQSYLDLPFPHREGLRAGHKNKRSTKNQDHVPFPDVVQIPRRRNLGSDSLAETQQALNPSVQSLESANFNSQLHNPSKQSIKIYNENANGHPASTHGQREDTFVEKNIHPISLPVSQIEAQQTRELDVSSTSVENDIQEASVSTLTVKNHCNEVQLGFSLIAHQFENTIPHQILEVYKEACSPFKAPVDGESNSNSEGRHPLRPPSQSSHQSRSQSVLSNTSRTMTRPLVTEDFVAQGLSEDSTVHLKQKTRIPKSRHSVTIHGSTGTRSDVERINPRKGSDSVLSTFQVMCQNMIQIKETLQNCETQKIHIELQQEELRSQAEKITLQQKELESQESELKSRQAKIDVFKTATVESNKQIKHLEEEKATLISRVNRFREISARYKAHMNDVVAAQNHLMNESSNMKRTSTQIREENKTMLDAIVAAVADRGSHERKLQTLIEDFRAIPPIIEKATILEEENTRIKSDLENAKQTNVVLQCDLNARMMELGRERHNIEQLRKSLNYQCQSHKELIEAFGRAQLAIVDELTKEGSVLSNLVHSENSIQAKIEELSGFVNQVHCRELELHPELVKLIDDLYSRIEKQLHATDNTDADLNETSLKRFEDLKESINQLRLGEDTKNSLNDRISELREINATFTASQTAREREIEGLMKWKDELERGLSGCRDQLTMKDNELATLRVLPKENQILLGKIHDLENNKTLLQDQVKTINQHMSMVKEELASCREIALDAQEQAEELQTKLTESREFAETLAEEKDKYLAGHKLEVDKACQEIAKASKASKAEAQLRHDCVAKNLEQQLSEAERERESVKEKLQKCEEEKASNFRSMLNLQTELSACEKKIAQQEIFIKHVDQRNPARNEFDRREQSLQLYRDNMTKFKVDSDTIQDEMLRKVEALLNQGSTTQKLIHRVNFLERDNQAKEKQNSDMQTKHEKFRDAVSERLRRCGLLREKQSVDEFIAALEDQSPPLKTDPHTMSAPKLDMHQIQSIPPVNTPSDFRQVDAQIFGNGMLGTPKEALWPSEQKQELSTHSNAKMKAPSGVTIRPLPQTVTESSMHFQSGSPRQTTPRTLRPANRKSSSLNHSVQIKNSLESSQKFDTTVLAHKTVPSRPSTNSQIPTNMFHDSAESSCNVSIHSLEQPRLPLTNSITSIIDISSTSPHNPTNTAIAVGTGLAPSSPLSELSSVDQFDFNDEDFENVHGSSKEMTRARHMDNRPAEVITPVPISMPTAAWVHFKATLPNYQLSDEKALSSARDIRRILKEESVRRRETLPPKSAMRKGREKQIAGRVNIAQGDMYQLVSTPNAFASQNSSTRTTTSNKQEPRGRKIIIGSSYNRIASGSKPGFIRETPGIQSTSQEKFAANLIVPNSEKSPLMKAPARIVRKRSASISGGKFLSTRPFKQPRVSLPNQGQRTNQTIIPDSQEAANYSR